MIKRIISSLCERYYKAKLKCIPDLWEEIIAYQAKTKSTGAKHATLYHVYKSVLRIKPRGIVECGTGLSTVVIAKAIETLQKLDLSYQPSFISFESEEFYWKHASDLLPVKYRFFVEIKLSKLIDDSYSIFRGVRYEEIPSGPYDFVFVDGPSYKTDKGGMSFCFDLLKYISTSQEPVHAIIDTRVSTVYVLQKILGTKLVKYCKTTRVGFVHGAKASDLSVLSEPPSTNFVKNIFSGALHLKYHR